MNDFYLPSLFPIEILNNIIYSSYIKDYFIFFTLLLSGYFAINYFTGYILGKIPYINKMFNFKVFWSYIIITPIIIIMAKALFSNGILNIFLGKYLFITIISSLTILIFVYSGTKQFFKQYKIIQFYKDYSLSIIIIILTNIYYYNSYFIKDKNEAIQVIINKVDSKIKQLKKENNSDYKLAKLIINYKLQATNRYIDKLKIKEQTIINDFNNKISKYDEKYITLSNKIDNSNKLISDLETNYKNKINIIDNQIDEEKLRLEAIYKEWKNNVNNNINHLDKLSKQYKKEIDTLETNKNLIKHFQNKLDLLKQRNSEMRVELLQTNDLISQNKDELTKNYNFTKNISNDLNKTNVTVISISTINSQNRNKIDKNTKDINSIQKQVVKNKQNLNLKLSTKITQDINSTMDNK
jgi:hypothetical protein